MHLRTLSLSFVTHRFEREANLSCYSPLQAFQQQRKHSISRVRRETSVRNSRDSIVPLCAPRLVNSNGIFDILRSWILNSSSNHIYRRVGNEMSAMLRGTFLFSAVIALLSRRAFSIKTEHHLRDRRDVKAAVAMAVESGSTEGYFAFRKGRPDASIKVPFAVMSRACSKRGRAKSKALAHHHRSASNTGIIRQR